MPRYRRYYWGRPTPYRAEEMPSRLDTGRRVLEVVPTPGHSATHSVFFDGQSGTVFTGDLFVSAGAGAVMQHENPFASVASLRQVAQLEPARLAGGHGGVIDKPAKRLRIKADRIEAAVARILHRHDEGWPVHAIQRELFRAGSWREVTFRLITGGEFSEHNFVRAVIAHQPQASDSRR